ncbi:MAG: helix-turn-helix transcriptional regulator [Bacillota bacterium]|nr:helix-turn-helix transcriptional regulator [Bacillota bacterium]
MTVGQRLKALREARKLSRQELATAVGLTYWALAKYEGDERVPDPATLVRIADHFGVTTDYLLGRTDQELPDRVMESAGYPESEDLQILFRDLKELSENDRQQIARIVKAWRQDRQQDRKR